jgi:pantothenate kinase
MSKTLDLDSLVAVVRGRGAAARSITAIAGAPGSGKSTLAEKLVERLNAEEPGSAAVLPMDGYHYDDWYLVPRGWRPRKGAPHTFDVAGFAHMLMRLRENSEAEIAVPVFDRDLEIAHAGARMIPSSVRHLVTEGNYLLLAAEPWSMLQGLFDTTVMIDVPEAELKARLLGRWRGFGYAPAEALEKAEGNDIPNGRLVMTESIEPQFVYRSE